MEDEKINSEATTSASVESKPMTTRRSEELESLKRMSTETVPDSALMSAMTAVEKCEPMTVENCKPLTMGKCEAMTVSVEKCESMVVSQEKCESITEVDAKGSIKMETEETEMERRKRTMEEELQPVLTRLPSEEPSCGSNCICINKDQVLVD